MPNEGGSNGKDNNRRRKKDKRIRNRHRPADHTVSENFRPTPCNCSILGPGIGEHIVSTADDWLRHREWDEHRPKRKRGQLLDKRNSTEGRQNSPMDNDPVPTGDDLPVQAVIYGTMLREPRPETTVGTGRPFTGSENRSAPHDGTVIAIARPRPVLGKRSQPNITDQTESGPAQPGGRVCRPRVEQPPANLQSCGVETQSNPIMDSETPETTAEVQTDPDIRGNLDKISTGSATNAHAGGGGNRRGSIHIRNPVVESSPPEWTTSNARNTSYVEDATDEEEDTTVAAKTFGVRTNADEPVIHRIDARTPPATPPSSSSSSSSSSDSSDSESSGDSSEDEYLSDALPELVGNSRLVSPAEPYDEPEKPQGDNEPIDEDDEELSEDEQLEIIMEIEEAIEQQRVRSGAPGDPGGPGGDNSGIVKPPAFYRRKKRKLTTREMATIGLGDISSR